MASLKPVVRISQIKLDNKCNIKIRVSHDRRVAYLKTPWDIEPGFMTKAGTISPKYPGQNKLNLSLNLAMAKYNSILAGLGLEIEDMDINTLMKRLRGQTGAGASLTEYFKKRTDELKRENRLSYAESYQVTLKHLLSFAGKQEIFFREITISFLRDFEAYLKQYRKSRINTIRIYLDNIRAVMNHAIDAEIIKPDIFPFRKYKIQQEQSRKRALDIEDLKKMLRILDSLPEGQRRSMDIFFLIFYLIGINMKDLLYLKPENIYKDRIFYSRFKTGREYSIKIFPEAKEIIDRYRGKKYLLRFMDEKEKITPKSRHGFEHRDLLNNVNKNLRIVARKIGLSISLSTYFARFSWATIASGLDIPSDIISHGLGHSMGNPTTAIYIDFNLKKVDEANEKVIKAVKL
jgi:integrase